ncbi:type VI secretion system Vgr family protein [Sandarakinorhabdus oryzae]|uniref:type VI secretion system Vgr family protein n=1 Tax=Sandarakinorhabdus oryzae TaxID=2675220 RepID=UPI0012E20D53|nr:type VI secretion system tip protein TssI/VgrG [Sandarakinorhabdus oryzae]
MPSSSNRIGKITTTPDRQLLLTSMTAIERLSELFLIEAEVVAEGGPVDLHECLSKTVTFSFDGQPHVSRHFSGILCEYAEVSRSNGGKDYHYRLVVRPEVYLQSLQRLSKIHYKKSIADLIQLLPNQQQKLQASYSPVEYRVQYEESKFEFVSRHMEREGIYYFFEHGDGSHKMVAVDNKAAHTANTPEKVRLVAGAPDGKEAVLTSLREHRRLGITGREVDDYDYTGPTVQLWRDAQEKTVGKAPKRWRTSAPSDVSLNLGGRYEHPGHYDKGSVADGQRYAKVRLEADRAEMARSHAEGDVFAAAVGRKLKVAFDESQNGEGYIGEAEYLIVATHHHYYASGFRSGGGGDEDMRVELELMPSDHPYRPALKTPMPRIMGPQTGKVVGPPGEEIYTDKYGRIKVEFFWDVQDYDGGGEVHARSLWLRVAQMSAGRGYGAFMIPRIGHEVVVDFLNGDPDRPLVTGSVYNEDNLPAFGNSAGNPVQGLRTNSSKGGGGFNEIRLDDTKDSEVFHVQAQKDLTTLVLKGNETRDIKEGNRTTTIDKGDETMSVKTGKRTTTIKMDETLTVEQGNRETTVSQGNDTHTLSMGNRTTNVKMGNDKLQIDLGKQETQAMQSIELKVGANSIKIDQTGITIKGLLIKIDASVMYESKGTMIQQQATAIHIVKGAMVMIN